MKRFLLLLTLSFSIVHAQQFSRVDVYDGFLPTTISVDPTNNLILAGEFLGTVDFDPGSGSTMLSGNIDHEESAISKYDKNGVLQWVSAIAGGCDTSFFMGNEPMPNNLIDLLATDQSGNVYVGGRFCGTADFDPGSGTTNLTAINAGGLDYRDAFLAKYNPSGNLVWAGLISGNGEENLSDLRIDASGNLYISGNNSQSADIDPGSGVTNISGSFFAKIDANGNLIWVKQFQGSPYGIGQLAPASDGTIYVAGSFRNTVDFDPSIGVSALTTLNGELDIFMARFDSDGDFIWALSWEQPGEDEDEIDLQADMTGHVYLSGYFENTMDMDPGAGTFNLTSAGSSDDFILKLDSAGDFVWAVRFGNSGGLQSGVDIKVENDGKVNFMGRFDDRLDVDPGTGTLNLGASGDNSNVYLGRLDPAGVLIWGRGITGFFVKEPYDLAYDGLGNLYYSGNFEGTVDFDPGTGEYNVQGGTLSDPFGYVLQISGGSVSAPDENAPLPFHLYPNPTYGSFTIDLGSPVQDVVVSVSTIDGKLVWQESYGRISKVSCAPDLASGMYLLKVEGKGKTPTYSKLSKK